MKLYRLETTTSRGWAETPDDKPMDGNWRPATKREWVWHAMTKARFSWIEWVVLWTIATIVQGFVRAALS